MLGDPRTERVARWGLVLVLVCIAVSFAPALGLALGDDHYGRILGRAVLHADNVLDLGLREASWGASWLPYASAPYAHHPPLGTAIHTVIAWLEGGASAAGARAVGTVSALVAAASVAGFARRAGGSWLPALLAGVGLAISGFHWAFGRLGIGVALPMLFIYLREVASEKDGHRWTGLLVSVALLAGLASWESAMIVGVICLLDLRSMPRRALVVGSALAVGLLLDVLWIESAAGLDSLFGHVASRAESADYSVAEWILRQGGFYLRFETIPTFVLTAVAVVAGLRDRRFRVPILALAVTLVTFVVVFHQNAWVHEYWNWKSSYLLALGLGAVGSSLSARGHEWLRWGAVGAVVVGAVVPVARLGGDLYASQFVESSKAGDLAERTVYPDPQTVAWTDGRISGPRWLAWYSGLPPAATPPDHVIDPEDLVLVKRWPDDGLDQVAAVDVEGRYALYEAGMLP